jgi:hypothetical protein
MPLIDGEIWRLLNLALKAPEGGRSGDNIPSRLESQTPAPNGGSYRLLNSPLIQI